MSRRWIRLDTTWSQSEWLAALPPESRIVWVDLLCYAKAHGTDGVVKVGYVALRNVTGVTRNAVDVLVTAAIEHGALVEEDGNWVITGWKEYQGDHTAAKRMKSYRQRQQQDDGKTPLRSLRVTGRNVTAVTPTETETETIEQPHVRKRPDYTPDFEEVWAIHRRGGKKATAFDEYRKALKQTDHATIVRALKAYVATFTGKFTGAHLYRWLKDSRWEEHQPGNEVVDLRAHWEAQQRIIHG